MAYGHYLMSGRRLSCFMLMSAPRTRSAC
jgi:hypothetical protein